MPKVTSKGQVTIPKELRDRFGLLPGSEVEFSDDGNAVYLRKGNLNRLRGEEIVAHLQRFRGDFTMTTDEIMELTRGED